MANRVIMTDEEFTDRCVEDYDKYMCKDCIEYVNGVCIHLKMIMNERSTCKIMKESDETNNQED